MVLDLCHELYVSGVLLQKTVPENEEHQRRRWLAPKVEAPKPVSKVPKPVPAVPGQASTCAPVALTSERAHRTTQPSTMASYVVGQTSPALAVPGQASTCAPVALTSERAMQQLAASQASAKFLQLAHCWPQLYRFSKRAVSQRSSAPSSTLPATRTLLAPAVSVLEKSRVPAFQRTIQHPAKQVHQTAPRVMMRVIQPAVYMPVQVQAAPQVVYPISRETSFLGYHPMAYPVYVNNRVAVYMPVQVQAAPQVVYPISRETSFLGYHPMAYPVYVNNRVLPSRVIVRA
eukprot:s9240_g1.t1